ncbi:hypothetical protein BGZ47_005528 [Haplosporangium gracile]|nr:hypothetical protein BGZ47_005528 [Haplosporangium gracile]
MNDYRLRAIDSREALETFFGNGPVAGLKLKEMVMSNNSTELFYWPTARLMKPEKNEHFWLKQWRRTTDPVEDRVGEVVKDLPDAIHFDVTKPSEGTGDRRTFDASATFKVNLDFCKVVEAMNDLVDKNWAFSSSEFPSRIGTCLEVRFIKASSKMMSFVYDAEEPEAIYCIINLLGGRDTPGFVEYSQEVLSGWIDKYNAKPHWAKLWEQIPGVIPALRREYKDRLAVLNRVRKTQDPFDMFVNDTWRPLLEERED